MEVKLDKMTIWLVLFMGFSFMVLCGILYFDFNFMREVNLSEYEQAKPGDYCYNIDSIEKKDECYQIKGWVFINNKEIENYNTKLVLWNDNEAKMISCKMEIRQDVTLSVNDGYNYDYCGFNISVDNKYIENDIYKIGFILEGVDDLVFIKTDELFD